ncbi:hypothetical protein ACTXT7_006445 [Hymenolepis weldensis]
MEENEVENRDLDDIGLGAVVGSADFNVMFVTSVCALFSKEIEGNNTAIVHIAHQCSPSDIDG